MFWFYSTFLLLQPSINGVSTDWPSPSSSPSASQLVGLFPDGENMSETTEFSIHSRAMFKAAVLLSQQYNITIDGEHLQWQARHTGGQMIDALSGTCQAVSAAKILGIVGPAFSREAPSIAAFARKIGIPVVSYAATDPDLSDRMNYRAFYRTVPSDNAAAFAIAKLFIRYNWTSCVIIHQNDAFGIGGAKIISQTFANNRLSVSELIVFDIATQRICGDLKSL
jgi:ABC-type branched-subunit amino acid transport system substrate-binding protein